MTGVVKRMSDADFARVWPHLAYGLITPSMQVRAIGPPMGGFVRAVLRFPSGVWCELVSGTVRFSDDESRLVWKDGTEIAQP